METGGGTGEAMLWRLLRIGSAPYFVLGSSAARSLRLRIATSWDWRQQYQLVSVSMEPQAGGQPRVGWEAVVRDRVSNELHEVAGHIEVRWSHGRFGGPPGGQGLPRHAAPPRAGVFHAPMSGFDPDGLHAPAARPAALVRRPSCSGPTPCPTSPWCARPRPTRSSRPSRRCPATYTDDAGRAFIERQHARADRGRRLLLRDRRGGRPRASGIGSIGLWLQEIESGRASIGYWLVAGARGRGLAAHALRAVVSFAFDELAIPRLHLFVEPWNVASARTAEAAGFRREATLRGWERIDGEQRDADCFALLLRPTWAAVTGDRGAGRDWCPPPSMADHEESVHGEGC